MTSCCTGFQSEAEAHFDDRVAQRDLLRYRRKGADLTTRFLRNSLVAAGEANGTLLDIGAGVGALTLELLASGVRSATSVEASAPYVAAGRAEATRRGVAEVIEWCHGDFVSIAHRMTAADLVTLDRVVCCYPSFESLLGAALTRAHRCVALSYPRGSWYVRATFWLENGFRRLRRVPFRTFVHSPEAMEAFVCRQGFRLVSRHSSLVWNADLYRAMSNRGHG